MNAIEERINEALSPYHLDERLVLDIRAGRPSPSRRRRIRSAIAAVAALAVVAIVLAIVLPGGAPGGPSAAAASLLHRFERIARNAQPEPTPEPGQYVYSETRSEASRVFVSGDGKFRFVYRVPMTEQRWLGLDGSGKVITSTGQPSFPTAADRAAYSAYVASGDTTADGWVFDWGASTTDLYAAGELWWRDTSGLPTDPAELGRLIDERKIVGGPPGDWESFALATDLIRDSYARPELRSALYSYMSGLSGIEVLGATTDGIGRTGIALASTHDGLRHVFVFDRKTAKILEAREVALEPDQGVYENPGPGEFAYAGAGQPIYTATYVTSGEVINSISDHP